MRRYLSHMCAPCIAGILTSTILWIAPLKMGQDERVFWTWMCLVLFATMGQVSFEQPTKKT